MLMKPVNTITPPLGYFPDNIEFDLVWRAVYHDGEGKLTSNCLNQFEHSGKENRYEDINRFLLGRFDLINKDGKVVYSLFVQKDQRLIYRRRVFRDLLGNLKGIVFIVGWQMTVYTKSGPRNIKAINYIYPDGSVALDDHRNNLVIRPDER